MGCEFEEDKKVKYFIYLNKVFNLLLTINDQRECNFISSDEMPGRYDYRAGRYPKWS